MTIFIVIIKNKLNSNVISASYEGYKTFEQAVEYIKSRYDSPKQYTKNVYESSNNIYVIREVMVK